MTFIQTTPPEEATGLLQEIYAQDLETLGYVANYTRAMSLRPEFIQAWRNLVRAIRGSMRLRRYELVTIAVSTALRCTY